MKLYHLIYTDEELTRELQDFRKEHALAKTGQITQRVMVRVSMVVLLALQAGLVISEWNAYRLF